MKKRLLFIAVMVIALSLALAMFVGAEEAQSGNKIIKLDECPTLAEIHANPDAYISRLAVFEVESTYKTTDPDSVIVLSDIDEQDPTYYVYPAYYLIRSTSGYYYISGNIANLNDAIKAADSTAFADYKSVGQNADEQWTYGECDYIIRVEIPKYVTQIHGRYKFEGSKNLKEIYFPTKIVIDEETGLEKEVAYVTSVSGENLFSSCTNLEYIHNIGLLPIGVVQGNNAGFSGCNNLREIEIPYGVTSIPNYCFKNCYYLTEIVLPNSVTYAGKQAFAYCTRLETIRFGASFTTFGSPNNDYETFSGTSAKFVYLPATFASKITATSNQFKNIFSSSTAKTIYFITENDLSKVETIQANFKATNANGNIAGATIELYDPEKDYVTYQQSLTKSVIVYGYNICDAFYNSEHDYRSKTDSCLDGVTCSQCKDNITTFTQHNCVETIVYSAFTENGKYNKYCANAANCMFEKVENLAVNPIFIAGPGFSTKENANDGISGGYSVDLDALEEYNRVNKDSKISFGIMIVNPNYLAGKDSFLDANGAVNAEKGFIQTDMTSTEYSNVSISLTGFTNAQDISLVIALYAITEDGEVQFVQSQTTACADKNVTIGDTTLYTVTFDSVKNGNTTVGNLGDYVMPTPKEEEIA